MTPTPARHPMRDYQAVAFHALRSTIKRGCRAIILVAPTGSGKTRIAAEMIDSAQRKGKRILFLAHRRELIEQCSLRLADLSVEHGIIKAADPRQRPWLKVHVCSVPTLVKREHVAAPDLCIIDECHRSASPSYTKIMQRFPNAIFIGLTATPLRCDGKGLTMYEDMVMCPPPAELIAGGWLVPTRIFAPPGPDVSGVGKQGGDYKQDELARAVDKPKLTGDVVEHWLKLASDRQTVAFAVNIEHSKHLWESFRAAGVPAEHLDGDMAEKERAAILHRLGTGVTRIVCSIGVLTEGWDEPCVSCAVLARPTASLSLYLQMAGRIMRPHPGKRDALLLDHAGCVLTHGFPDDPREWSLEGVRKGAREIDPALSVRTCLYCWAAFSSRCDKCPHCGWLYDKKMKEPEVVEGTLEEITLEKRKAYVIKKLSRNPEMARLQKIAEEKGYKPGWVFRQMQLQRGRRIERAVAG